MVSALYGNRFLLHMVESMLCVLPTNCFRIQCCAVDYVAAVLTPILVSMTPFDEDSLKEKTLTEFINLSAKAGQLVDL